MFTPGIKKQTCVNPYMVFLNFSNLEIRNYKKKLKKGKKEALQLF